VSRATTPYDNFAPFYDHVVGEREDVAQFILALIKRYHPKAESVLEFGCGSGSMLRVLTSHYTCTGIDNSQAMLARARKKSPRARLVHGDIRKTNLTERFDVVAAPFDTINHITTLKGWRAVFANAARHMAPKGVFIFDINTPAKMERYCHEPVTAEVTKDRISLVDVKRGKGDHYEITARLLARTKGDSFTMHSMKLKELILHPKEVLRELSEFFQTITIVDPERRYANEESEEVYFVCRNGFRV
jgi:SAM-dependent methyltransferase